MSFVRAAPIRSARPALRLLQGRRLATSVAGESATMGAETDFMKERAAIEHHAAKSADLWRKITYYVAFPAVLVGALNAKSMMDEHEEHAEHIKEENGGELPERIVYPYMNKRDKPFPWGMRALFFNPKTNIPVEE